MDAVKRGWHVFRALVFTRPLLFVVLSLFYLVAASLPAMGVGMTKESWIGFALLCAFPAVGIFAIATERMTSICASSAELRIPWHVASLRIAQAALVLVFVGVPMLWIGASAGEGGWSLAVTLVMAAALGTAFVTHKWVAIGVWLLFFLGLRTEALWSAFANPLVQAVLAVGAVYLLYRWFLLPDEIERTVAQVPTWLADASHEATDEAFTDTFDPKAVGHYEESLTALVRRAREEIAVAPAGEALALGLGFGRGVSWTLWLRGIGLGVLASVAWHFFHGRYPEALAYWAITVIAALVVMSRTSSIIEAWRQTPEEQSVLKLMPRWPSDPRLKRLFLGAIVRAQVGAWLGWGALSIVGLLLESFTSEQLATGAFALMAASCASIAAFAMLLARRSLKSWHLTSICAVLGAIVGTVIFALRPSSGTYPVVIAFVVVLSPMVIGIAAMMVRPLLFPTARVHGVTDSRSV